MAVGPKGGQSANMNVTPLIDVLLVLFRAWPNRGATPCLVERW
jgi:hypothetical protein